MPYTNDQLQIPFSGRSSSSRHRSYKAAVAQVSTRGQKKVRVLNYIIEHSAHGVTDRDIASALGLEIPGVCSLRNALWSERKIEECGERPGPYGLPCTTWRVAGYVAQERAAC